MARTDLSVAAGFAWMDLAATDAQAAGAFYEQVFGWRSRDVRANGGRFTCLQAGDRDIGSIYQLNTRSMEQGMPSHWMPYVRVGDLDQVLQRVMSRGGRPLVNPFVVAGVARIAVVLDTVGAQVGLWQQTEA